MTPDDRPLSPNHERRLAIAAHTAETTPACVAQAVEAIMGWAVTGEPRFFPAGLGNENWRVETQRGPLLCKIGATGAPTAKWQAAAKGAELARAAGIAAPRLVSMEENCPALGGRPVRLFELIEGINVEEIGGLANAPEHFWAAFGEAVRRMHEIRLPSFSSRLDGSAPAFPTWGSYLGYRIPQILERVDNSGFLPAKSTARLLAAVEAAAVRLSGSIFPALTHRDLHPDNLLLTPEGGLAAILDWDQAEAWDPAADFFKLQWLVFEEAPQGWPVFASACGVDGPLLAPFEMRLQIASAVELVSTIAGCTPEETLAVERLSRRLNVLAEQAGWPIPG